jgi:ribosomal protein L37AE/L43A
MMAKLSDSGLDGLKATMRYCPECQKSTVHYSAQGGWPVCHACGYNAELEKLAETLERKPEQVGRRRRWPWDR